MIVDCCVYIKILVQFFDTTHVAFLLCMYVYIQYIIYCIGLVVQLVIYCMVER